MKNKRTSLVPTWMSKKNKSKANKEKEQAKLADNIPDTIQDKENNSNDKTSKIEFINNTQPYEKITLRNTTTRSIERIDPDGFYTNAVETKENIEEKIIYTNKKSTFNKDDAIDINPTENNKFPKENKLNHNLKKYLPQKNLESTNLKAVKNNGLLIKEIDRDEQTEEVALAAVSQNGLSLKYIRNQTHNICIRAIRQNYLAFNYVRNKNEHICREAVNINGLTLEFIKNQTPKICLDAVKQNPFALEFVIEQTYEICEAALFRNGLALEFVKDKTIELCLLALSQNSQSIKYIPISLISGSLDFSDYVFVCTGSKSIVPFIPKIRGLNRINLPYNENNFCLLNTLKYNNKPINFVLERIGFIDDEFIYELKENNHFVLVLK